MCLTFEGKAKLFQSETCYIELVAFYVHPKNSNHLQYHIQELVFSRTIMALDHSRLGLENKFLENKSGRILCVRQVFFTNSCHKSGSVYQPFILSIHHICGETVPFTIQTSNRMRYFTIFQNKLHSVNIRDDQSWAFGETVQKISKITHTAISFLVQAVILVKCLNEL